MVSSGIENSDLVFAQLRIKMGITGELVKSVFSRNRSIGTHENNARSSMADKRRWISVRSYLCGHEFNSVLAEEDSASVKSSEATVTQPLTEERIYNENSQDEERNVNKTTEQQNSISKLFRKEDAAIIIQSAFRRFQARRRTKEIITEDVQPEPLAGTESPSRKSWGTSIEVQTGHSVEAFSVGEESTAIHQRAQQKPKTQIFKVKDDWDDSTVSSNISKMRIQNRLEATTRRERALAYAFSQQLRICSKKKQTRSDGTEPNMGWSWLERWMATRLPESCLVENHVSKQLETINSNQRILVGKRFSDVAGEEKESCGSNELSVQFDSLPVTAPKEKGGCRPPKNRLKAPRNVSRRKTVPSYQFPKECAKVSTKDFPGGAEKIQKLKHKQPLGKQDTKCKDASQGSPDLMTIS